uniref:Uncharacterized protein n=1 Tax=Avena sativa TaxID=4498 RepID=A0ACD5XGW7_AVESA
MAAERFEDGKDDKTTLILLQSEDGVEFVVSELEASQSKEIDRNIWRQRRKQVSHLDGGDETKCSPIRLSVSVQGRTLAKVIEYWKKHACGGTADDADADWDAEFIHVDHETLFDLVWASNYLQIQGLLGLACKTLANKIKGKSPNEICHILNIRNVFTPEIYEEQSSGCCTSQVTAAMEIISNGKTCVNQELQLLEKTLWALDIVRCQEFTVYDPKHKGFVCYRFNNYNMAFFDYDKETSFYQGPPLHTIPAPMCESTVRSCVNVVSLKVRESDVGFPINVFGTVIARDQLDYRCVYLFRRESDDSQFISSRDDMLSLTDPCRALVPDDKVYFEINLKIRCDGGAIKDLSKGVVNFDWVRLPTGKETRPLGLESMLSSVELSCAHVYHPVEATIAINILKGPCILSRVAASTPGNFRDHIILYDDSSEAATGTRTVLGDGVSVPLTRRVVAVPLKQKLVLFLVGGDVLEHLALTLGHSDEVLVRKMGSAEVEVRVAWTAVPVYPSKRKQLHRNKRLVLHASPPLKSSPVSYLLSLHLIQFLLMESSICDIWKKM